MTLISNVGAIFCLAQNIQKPYSTKSFEYFLIGYSIGTLGFPNMICHYQMRVNETVMEGRDILRVVSDYSAVFQAGVDEIGFVVWMELIFGC